MTFEGTGALSDTGGPLQELHVGLDVAQVLLVNVAELLLSHFRTVHFHMLPSDLNWI